MQNASLALITNSDQQSLSILLVRRKDTPVWVLPGGGIEQGELPEYAAIRETHEETGLTVEIIHHIATYHPINRLAATTYLFSCRSIGTKNPTIFKENDEVDKIQFFPLDDLPSSLFPFHRNFIMEWHEAKTIPITRSLSEITYFSIIKLMFIHPILSSKYCFAKMKRFCLYGYS